MALLIIGQADVARLLPMDECIRLVEKALAALARGQAVQPLRNLMAVPETSGLLGTMPGYLASPRALGVKLVSVYPDNAALGLESHQGVVALFDADTGTPLAIMDAHEITAIRTAAASAVATRALAREDAASLAILGCGVQARTHLEAMACVRPLARVVVWGRSADKARAFAEAESARSGLAVEVAESAEAAVAGADILCTVTGSPEPVVRGGWLREGVHINAVGTATPTTRELDTEAVVRSRLYVDHRESALAQAGEFVLARDEGAIDESHILGEIGEVLVGRAPGRESAADITLFKSLGIVAEDLAAAHHVYAGAREQGLGTEVEL